MQIVLKRMGALALLLLLLHPGSPSPYFQKKKKNLNDEFLLSWSIAEIYVNRNMLTVGKQ